MSKLVSSGLSLMLLLPVPLLLGAKGGCGGMVSMGSDYAGEGGTSAEDPSQAGGRSSTSPQDPKPVAGTSPATGGASTVPPATGGASTVPPETVGGIGSSPSASCGRAVLENAGPVIAGCLSEPTGAPFDITRLRCAFPKQLNVPDYGAFVACCSAERPYGCPNGTPQSCYATAQEAASACGEVYCQLCVPWGPDSSSEPGAAGAGGAASTSAVGAGGEPLNAAGAPH